MQAIASVDPACDEWFLDEEAHAEVHLDEHVLEAFAADQGWFARAVSKLRTLIAR